MTQGSIKESGCGRELTFRCMRALIGVNAGCGKA